MQCAPIVPHQEVAGTPDVLVDEFAALLVVEQQRKQLIAFLRGQPFDAHRHEAIDVERFATGYRMGPHHWMHVGWHVPRDPWRTWPFRPICRVPPPVPTPPRPLGRP